MKYLKYLSEKPGKIAYYIIILTIYSLINRDLIINWDTSDVSKGWLWTIIIGFDLLALPIALLQPYHEYRSNKKEEQRIANIKKEFNKQ